MLDINFDFIYELKQGSVVSNTLNNVTQFWRMNNGKLEYKTKNKETEFDWHISELFIIPLQGKFQIEERFERFKNG